MTTLVTGGSGFVGSHTLRRLVETGGEETISFSRSPPPEDIAEKVKVVDGDVRFLTSILNAIKMYNVEKVIHTASMLGYASERNPRLAFDTNVVGTMNILEAARIMDIRRVSYVSGSFAYGPTKEGEWVVEDHPLNPVNLYAAIKCFCERLGLSYVKNYGLDWVAVRFPIVYGPGQSLRGSHTLKDCIEGAVFKRHVRIHSGGDEKFAPLYVKDAANGLVLTIRTEKLKHRIFNIGPGIDKMYTLHDLFNIIKKFIPDATFEICLGEIYHIGGQRELTESFLDITRAREELNYEPQYPRLEDGVKDYVEALTKGMFTNKS